jgi:hypothetical protein
MSISIKKRASASAVLAVIAWCWRVSIAASDEQQDAGSFRAAAGCRDEG